MNKHMLGKLSFILILGILLISMREINTPIVFADPQLGDERVQKVFSDKGFSSIEILSSNQSIFNWPSSGYIYWLYNENNGNHNGFDIWTSRNNCNPSSTSEGKPVYPVASGDLSWYTLPGGKIDGVRVDHGLINGVHLYTHYWHLASYDENTGEITSFVVANEGPVDTQTLIGYQGNLNRVDSQGNNVVITCVHLHLTVSNGPNDSDDIDPSSYFGEDLVAPPPVNRGFEVNSPNTGTSSVDILQPTQSNPALVGSKDNPIKTYIHASVVGSDGAFIVGLDADDFDVSIGGLEANVITVINEVDQYKIEVQPPVQSTEGIFDLTVSALNASDSEPGAVQYSASSNVDVMLVIDRSGSMGGTPIINARNSSKLFVDQMNFSDMIGVTSFSSSSIVDFPLITITSDNEKANAKFAIDSINSGGNTSIGAGLEDGRDELLSKGDSNHPWIIVLLSDGQENTAPYVSSVLPSVIAANIKVFTIGLGSVDEALMQDIANQTGGSYYYTPSDTELIAIYNSISGQVAGRQTLISQDSSVQQGETSQQSVVLDSSVQETIFTLSWTNPGSDLDLTLVTPSGQIIDPQAAQTDPDIEYIADQTYEFYKISNPEFGDWTSNVYGANTSTEAFNISVQSLTNLTLEVTFGNSSLLTSEPIHLQASLSDNDPIQGAWLTAQVQRPDGNLDTMILYDDGQHSDGKSGDGVYANFYSRSAIAGSYQFSLGASGQSTSGDQFERVLSLSAAVTDAEDSDGDGMPDEWELREGLDYLFDDSNDDEDNDTLPNIEEYQNGTKPFYSDTDSDGLSDGDEVVLYSTNPTNEDTDLGGVDDGTEILRGTDPLDPSDDGLTDIFLPVVTNNTSSPGFNSQFNSSAPGWQTHSGTWTLTANHYTTPGLPNAWASASYDDDFSDFDYQARLRRSGCDVCSYGLMVRGAPTPLGTSNRWDSGYAFYVNQNGQFSVFKYTNGNAVTLQDWTDSPAIVQGDNWNDLQVVASGNSLSFSINGTLVWTGTDNAYSSGRVGILMYRTQDSTGDLLRADWATLSPLSSTQLALEAVSAEQQTLNEAADGQGEGEDGIAP